MAEDLDKLWADAKPVAPAAQPGGEDLEALWHQAAPHPATGPSGWESGARGLANGATFGFAPALAGAGSALIDKIKGDKRDLNDLYDVEREDSKRNFDAAQKANPTAYGIGNVAGGVASGLALTPLTGGASLAGAVGAGALAGGLQGAGEATSSGEGASDTLVNTLKGAGLGGLSGLGGAAGGKLLGSAIQKVAPGLGAALDKGAVAMGRRAIRGGANTISAKAEDLGDRAVLRAIDDKVLRGGRNVGEISEALDNARTAAGQQYGNIVKNLEAEGVRGPEAKTLADTLSTKAGEIEQNSIGSEVPAMYSKHAEELPSKLGGSSDNRLSLTQAENIKRSAADQARNEYSKLGNGMVGDAKMDIADTFKRGIEDEVEKAGMNAPRGSRLEQLADQFVPSKEATSDYIAMSNAAAKGAAQASKRSIAGPVASGAGLIAAATGHPWGLLASGAYQVAKNRGASTAAVGMRSLSKNLGNVAATVAKNPAALGRYGGVLSRALAQGADKYATTNFLLSKDPGYQQMAQTLPDATKDDE